MYDCKNKTPDRRSRVFDMENLRYSNRNTRNE